MATGWSLRFPLRMKQPRSVVMVGNFDGVHAGHAALAARARQVADAAVTPTRVVALAFDPHPITLLRPGTTPERLTTFQQRAAYLGRLGVDEVVRLEPTGNLLSESPEQFVARVVEDLSPIAVVEVPDFRFGRGRSGDIQTLRRLGASHGFEVHIVDPVSVVLTDQTTAVASSTLARWLVAQGRVGDVRAVLGRPYEMAGVVVKGDRRGRTIGYPTANIDSACLSPADGVYSGIAALEDGRVFGAAISVGTKPTFGPGARAVEAYLLDALPEPRSDSGAIRGLPEYGWPIRLEVHHWLRDQVRFGSLAELLGQMARDCRRVRELQGIKEEAACR